MGSIHTLWGVYYAIFLVEVLGLGFHFSHVYLTIPQPRQTPTFAARTDVLIAHLPGGEAKKKLSAWLRAAKRQVKKTSSALSDDQVKEILCYLFPKKARQPRATTPRDFPRLAARPAAGEGLKQSKRDPGWKTAALNFDLFFPNFEDNQGVAGGGVQPAPLNLPAVAVASLAPPDAPDDLQSFVIAAGVGDVASRSSRSSMTRSSTNSPLFGAYEDFGLQPPVEEAPQGGDDEPLPDGRRAP